MTRMVAAQDAERGSLASPLSWSVGRRLGWAAMACAGLWLAVLWALS